MGVLNSFAGYYSLTYRELHSKHLISDKLYILLNQSGLFIVEDLYVEYESPSEFFTMANVLGLIYDDLEQDINIMIDSLNNNPAILPIYNYNKLVLNQFEHNLANKPMLSDLTFKELVRKKCITRGLYKRLVDRANVNSIGDYLIKYNNPEAFRNDVKGVGAIYMLELVNLLNCMYKNPKKFVQLRNQKAWKRKEFLIDASQHIMLSSSTATLRFDILHSKNIIDHTLYYRLLNADHLYNIGDFMQRYRSTENFQYSNDFIGPGTINKLNILFDNLESILVVNKYK